MWNLNNYVRGLLSSNKKASALDFLQCNTSEQSRSIVITFMIHKCGLCRVHLQIQKMCQNSSIQENISWQFHIHWHRISFGEHISATFGQSFEHIEHPNTISATFGANRSGPIQVYGDWVFVCDHTGNKVFAPTSYETRQTKWPKSIEYSFVLK